VPDASAHWGKPDRVQVKKELSRWNKIKVIEKVVCEVSRFVAEIPLTLFVKNLEAICPASLRPCRKPVQAQTGRQ
jgi:hypothetical protein